MPGANKVLWAPPLTRLNPWMPGQIGVEGGWTETGLRQDCNGTIFWVDPNHVDTNDNRDGTDPTEPLETIGEALTKCVAYHNDVIAVNMNSGWQYSTTTVGRGTLIQEEVTVDVPGVRIVGLSSSSLGIPWIPINDGGIMIDVTAMDTLVEGFCFFDDGLDNGVGIRARWDGPPWGDNLTVRNCYFSGELDYGIQLDFTYNCLIENNTFDDIQVAAIHSLDNFGDPDFSQFIGNVFRSCAIAFNLEDSSMCLIKDNAIYGAAGGTNNMIDLTGGADNLVVDNYLSCTIAQYDTTCSDATSGAWLHNMCNNGIPAAPPT